MKKWVRLVLCTAAVLLGLYTIFMAYQRHENKADIPAKLEIVDTIHLNLNSDYFQGCSFAIYALSPNTLKRIDKEGSRFFDDAVSSGSKRYAAWKKLPISPAELDEGNTPPGYHCAENLDGEVDDYIRNAAQGTEGFYTTRGNTVSILVLPEKGYAVYSSFD